MGKPSTDKKPPKLGVFLTPDQKKKLLKEADKRGLSQNKLVSAFIDDGLKRAHA